MAEPLFENEEKNNVNNYSNGQYNIKDSRSALQNYSNISDVPNGGLITQPKENIFLFANTCFAKSFLFIVILAFVLGCLISSSIFIYKFIINDYNYIYCACAILFFGLACYFFIWFICFFKDIYLIIGDIDITIIKKYICRKKTEIYLISDLRRFEINIENEKDNETEIEEEKIYFDLILANEEIINIYKDRSKLYKKEEINFLLDFVNRRIQVGK